MTDLVKVYRAKGPAVAAAKKAELDPATALVMKRGEFAVVPVRKVRSHVIKTPSEMTIREYVWARCNERQPEFAQCENPYKALRRAVIDDAAAMGFKLSGIQAEISRWRHRFN